MKLVKTLGLILLFALLASTAAATPSKNSEMPTEDQFSTWISGFSGEENFVSSAYNGYIEEFPKCHVDKIESNGEIVGIVFYTSDPSEGAEGYDSHYYDAKGDKMGIGCDGSFKLVDSYTGEGSPEKEVTEEEDEKEEVTEEEHSYEDLGEALDDYEGKLSRESIYLVNENGYFEGDADGGKLKIHNNRRALNPTYEGLMDFLKRNTIDERDYEYPTYTCGNFATDLHDAAENEFIRAGIVVIRSKENGFDHTINVFKTVDKGYIFIDCTSDKNKDGAEDLGDCIAEFGMDGYTITSIENPDLSITRELPGETQFSYYW